MKKILLIVLAIALVLSLSTGCNNSRIDDDIDDEPISITIGGVLDEEPDDPVVEEPDDPVVEEPDDPVVDEPDEPEEPDEPPFLTTLRTGVYGYIEEHIIVKDRTIEGKTFVYSNGSLMAFGVIDDDGEVISRYILDYETNTIYGVYDEVKKYNFKEDIDFWHSFGIPDFYSGLDQSGKGTTEFDGETLDYIDCGSGEEAVVQVIIKDGDVYAFQYNNNGWAHTSYLRQTYSSPPTNEYFEIPDDYELAS